MDEAIKIYNGYWELYAPTKAFNDLAVKEAKQFGHVTSRFSGIRVKMASINAKDEYVRSKEERRAANFKIQSGNFLMLRSLHEFQNLIETSGMLGKVFIYNTVHDSGYVQIEDNDHTIKWVNDTLPTIMCRDYKEDQALKLEAELDIGYNQKQVVTLKNNCPIDAIKEAKEKL